MTLLKILHHPHPKLRLATKVVEGIKTEEIQKLIDDMFETMYAVNGVGLAATQVGIDKQLAVIDVSKERNQPLVLINPEIMVRDEIIDVEEGCLSVPSHYDSLKRARRIKMRALDREGKPYELEAQDLLAQCIQHEIDHLHGKLYIDYLSELKRQRILAKLKKIKRKSN